VFPVREFQCGAFRPVGYVVRATAPAGYRATCIRLFHEDAKSAEAAARNDSRVEIFNPTPLAASGVK
jgi:hypothetical protein